MVHESRRGNTIEIAMPEGPKKKGGLSFFVEGAVGGPGGGRVRGNMVLGKTNRDWLCHLGDTD